MGDILAGIILEHSGVEKFYTKWHEILKNTIYSPEINEKWTMASSLESKFENFGVKY